MSITSKNDQKLLKKIYDFTMGDRAVLDEQSSTFDVIIKIGKPIALIIICIIIVVLNALVWVIKYYNDPIFEQKWRRHLTIISMILQNIIMFLLFIAVYHRYVRKKNMDWETAVSTLLCAGFITLLDH